ncbi:UNKNOWN [Stylonychia lemnae]|uniref:Uncharacterized protein n=1 Tax=Stylonychia lemnae TaxID=5949 RepID=A0A078A8I4_STYLE|nr:UNKNOWN [Stylonychia lemnae]|eukprot:CDW77096.1 UNKNOWN [Stylonychia lemnae]
MLQVIEIIDYKIQDVTKSSMVIRLFFKDITQISKFQFKDMSLFYDRFTNRFTPNYVMQRGVPSQISEGTNLIATLLMQNIFLLLSHLLVLKHSNTYGALQILFRYLHIYP